MKYLILTLLLSCHLATAKQVRIAVLDTGFTRKNNPTVAICPDGLINLTKAPMDDKIGHGSNVIGLIARELGDADYCMYVVKIYSDGGEGILPNYFEALNKLPIDIINFSSTGLHPSATEIVGIKRLLRRHVVFVTSTGNKHINLDENPIAWPGLLPGVIMVGSVDKHGMVSSFSNYGTIVDAYEYGENQSAGGYTMSGSSQATAIHTGKLAKQLSKEK